MMVTDLRCWWQNHYVGDFLCWWFSQCTKSVTNISNLSPTHLASNIRHQHQCNLFSPLKERDEDNSFEFRFRIGWYFKADKSFRELFLEGDGDNTGTCNAGCAYPGCSCCDYVEILDSDEKTRLGRFCGTKIPPQIIRFVRIKGKSELGNMTWKHSNLYY